MIAGAAFWSAAYVLIVWVARRDRVPAIPMIALAGNLAWEVVFTVVLPHSWPYWPMTFVWLCLDLVILVQFFLYPAPEWSHLSVRWTRIAFGFTFTAAAALILALTRQWENYNGAYAAFGQNVVMSAAFVGMYARRGFSLGQSPWIAALKLTGTGLNSAAFWAFSGEGSAGPLLPTLCVTCFLLDAVYLGLLLRARL